MKKYSKGKISVEQTNAPTKDPQLTYKITAPTSDWTKVLAILENAQDAPFDFWDTLDDAIKLRNE